MSNVASPAPLLSIRTSFAALRVQTAKPGSIRPAHITAALNCPGLVHLELARETERCRDTDACAALVMKYLPASEFYVVPRVFNFTGMQARWRKIGTAFRKYAPRDERDDAQPAHHRCEARMVSGLRRCVERICLSEPRARPPICARSR
jgi:hypothetical protein